MGIFCLGCLIEILSECFAMKKIIVLPLWIITKDIGFIELYRQFVVKSELVRSKAIFNFILSKFSEVYVRRDLH